MKENDLHTIEKIIKKVGDKYLIRWRNYSSEFDSLVNKNNIVKYL